MKEAFEMRLGIIVALAAIAMTALIARDCSARKDDAATKVETAGDAVAGGEPQSAEFALFAKDELKVRAK